MTVQNNNSFQKLKRVVVKEEIVNLTKDFKLALILTILNDYTNDTGNYLNFTDFNRYNFCIDSLSIQTIRRSLLKLEKLGLIKIIKTKPQKIAEILINKKLMNKGIGNKICEWCKIRTFILHKHHYPIPKSKGGTETIKICSNCHAEFHAMEYEIFIPQKVKEVFE